MIKEKNYVVGIVLAFALVLVTWPNLAKSQSVPMQVLTKQEASRVLTLENISERDGAVSGDIRNNSANLIRDVQLLIRYEFIWNDEFHPGKDDPSRSVDYDVPGQIAPHEMTHFQYTPSSPLPKRRDGRFMVMVSVAGFTQVIPPGAGLVGSVR
jgi:hypothetical protein